MTIKQSSRHPPGPWQRTFTAREPGSGSQIKNRVGSRLRSQMLLKGLTTKSSWPLSTTEARSVPRVSFFYHRQNLSLPWLEPLFQEIAIDTTVKAIRDGQDDLPPLRNPPLLETADDLATLSHLNEPSGAFPPSRSFLHSSLSV